MPTIKPNFGNTIVLYLHVLKADCYILRKSLCAVPNLLNHRNITSYSYFSTLSGIIFLSLDDEYSITFAPNSSNAIFQRFITKSNYNKTQFKLNFQININILIQMKSKSLLKLPNQLNLGTILPGQYGQICLPLKSSSVAFLNLELSKRAVSLGYFLLREGTNDCKNEMSLIIKPGVTTNIIVASYPEQVSKSTTHNGQLYISE